MVYLNQLSANLAKSRVCATHSLAMMSRRFIKMPSSLDAQQQTMRKFRSIANFPTVIGAIDCTHIRVKKINADGGQLYINRKGFSSINVQRFEAGAFSGILLGDSGYPCTPYLFTPLLNPTTPQEERYNRSHIRTRNTVERCFGLLKQRFRCLLRGMFGDIETAQKTIVACAVLHNIAIDMREDLFPGEEDNIEPSIQFAPSETVQQGYFPSSVREILGEGSLLKLISNKYYLL
ncbi:hypothetical protein HF086_002440 [Spodoptera exigua]|uniref:DDE Tnp4 domain-containing protein n=1 Tax=Spodoptera exigua TaxID=7107 RepID=A0A922MG78_SPOEX|nr:hypothetical protein HF086_002440 [Spodoptera exigua]